MMLFTRVQLNNDTLPEKPTTTIISWRYGARRSNKGKHLRRRECFGTLPRLYSGRYTRFFHHSVAR